MFLVKKSCEKRTDGTGKYKFHEKYLDKADLRFFFILLMVDFNARIKC